MKLIYKTYFFNCIFLLFINCEIDKAKDCLGASDKSVTKEITADEFDKIIVLDDINLVIKQGNEQKISLTTAENYADYVRAFTEDNTLILKNELDCELTKTYNKTFITITTNQLSYLKNGSNKTIQSQGILSFPKITLVSESEAMDREIYRIGDFNLTLNTQTLSIRSNGKSNFFLTGNTINADINILEDDSRIVAENLEVENATVFHRGTNHLFLNVQNSITGEMRSTGNIYLSGNPSVIDVKQLFKGKLIKQE